MQEITLLDGLANIMSGAGTTVDRRMGQFYAARPLDWQQIDAMYRSSWTARKIVDLPAAEMTRPKRDWQAEDTDIAPLEELERKVRLWAKLEEALRLGRLGGGVMVIGVKQGQPDQPLRVEALGRDSLQYLHVMSRSEITTGEIDMDPASEGFGCPLYYEIMGNDRFVRIHPSRVIPFTGEYVSRAYSNRNDSFWGVSILEIVRDAVQNADSAQNGFAALIEEASIDVLGVPDLTQMSMNPDYERRYLNRLTLANTAKSTHRMMIRDAAETWEQHDKNFANMPEVMMAYLAIVAGACSMPATVLLGKSPDGMNSTGEGDMQNWYRTLDGWRESELRPALDRLDPIIKASAGVLADDVWWDFGSFYEEPMLDKSGALNSVIDGASKAINAGMPSEPVLEATANAMVESGLYPGLDQAMAQLKKELAQATETAAAMTEAELTAAARTANGEAVQ